MAIAWANKDHSFLLPQKMDAFTFRPRAKTLTEEAQDALRRTCKQYNEASLFKVLLPWEWVQILSIAAAAILVWTLLISGPSPLEYLFPELIKHTDARWIVHFCFLLWSGPIIFFPAAVFAANVCIEKDQRFGGVARNAPIEQRVRSLFDDPAKQRMTEYFAGVQWPPSLREYALLDKVYGIVREMEEQEDSTAFEGRSRVDQVEAVCRRALFLYLSEEAH
jgi:hypothetical protein